MNREMKGGRGILSTRGMKIIMTSAFVDLQNKIGAFSALFEAYLTRLIHKEKFPNE
jgi:hypothetical protein